MCRAVLNTAFVCPCPAIEEDDKAAQQAAEEARKKSGKQQEQPSRSRPDWGSVPGNLQQAIDEKKAKRSSKKAMFADDGGDAAVQVSVKVRCASPATVG